MADYLYNVRIELKKDPEYPIFRFNLSSELLKKAIVEPYSNEKAINLSGRIIAFDDMWRLNIRQVEKTWNDLPRLLRILDNFLSTSESKFRGNGVDVTEKFLVLQNLPELPSTSVTSAPDLTLVQMFDALVKNESIRQASRQLFLDGHYSSSVDKAFVTVDNAVKEKSGRSDLDGADLMHKVFSANSPILKINAFQSQSDKNEQLGYMEIFAGSMTGIRNPRVHQHDVADEPEVALELLGLANHLMRKLDAATKNEPEAA